jgi:hypothetical protein
MKSENLIATEQQLKGPLSLTFLAENNFIQFCKNNFNNFDPEHHEAIAFRVFHGEETIVTLYALDKFRKGSLSSNTHKLPVKKFKNQGLALSTLWPYIQEFNFTVSTGKYDLEDMEVINK